MRIRTIKPQFFTHPEVVVVSIPARLLFISLLTQADDEGRLYDQPRKIAGLAFGDDDDIDIAQLLAELEVAGRILRYKTAGRACIQVANFGEHQRIPPTKFKGSEIPAPRKSWRRKKVAEPLLSGSQKDARNKEYGIRNKEPDNPSSGLASRLCEILADLIEGNGARRPTYGTTWLVEAERLLRLDKVPFDEAERVLRWSQADPFWRSNILSMPKFREKYDQLRLRMNAPRNGRPTDPGRATYEQAEELERRGL